VFVVNFLAIEAEAGNMKLHWSSLSERASTQRNAAYFCGSDSVGVWLVCGITPGTVTGGIVATLHGRGTCFGA